MIHQFNGNVWRSRIFRTVLLVMFGGALNGCVESFDVKTETFEEALVVDATITNELKEQEIVLGRSFLLEEFDFVAEENAQVRIIDDAQNAFVFQETTPGRYLSTSPFSAQTGTNYQLLITTQNGREYASELTSLPPPDPMQNLYASRTNGDNGEEGIAIFVDFNAPESERYYRYEYEETYKIIAPRWTGSQVVFITPAQPEILPAYANEHICYNSNASEGIIIASTNGPAGGTLTRFRTRFIDREDYILSHRYSILVRQHVISKAAYSHFELLEKFSGQDNVLSQSQPGFFRGNMYSIANSDEKVLGYFDVSSLSEKRIFFDYADFFPGEPLPPYAATECDPFVAGFATFPTIADLLKDNLVRYYSTDPLTEDISVVLRGCADCTVFGDPEVPEFWID